MALALLTTKMASSTSSHPRLSQERRGRIATKVRNSSLHFSMLRQVSPSKTTPSSALPPLGMDHTRLHLDGKGHAWTYADAETTPRDLARLGLLILHKGASSGRRIVSEAWIETVTTPSQRMNPRYGLLWWIDHDAKAIAMHGHLDTDVHIVPDLSLVVVRMQAKPFGDLPEGTYEREAVPLYREFVVETGRER